ncbi:MAG: sigma-70 family RNA polymerase sigma factor [Burkholderiales bacterium]|nr:sigma-70 family RNA polymerase sigma factor [Burkholderiales bacterium]
MQSTPPVPADEELMLSFAAGSAAAFDLLYARHEKPLYRFIVRCIGNSAGDGVAEELFQETWFAVMRHAPGYQPHARFTTWLYTIARHRVIDQVRRTAAAGGISASLDDEDGEGAALAETLAADERDEPLARLQTRAQAQAFLVALDALPAEQREAFLLQAEAGLSLEEIAAATSVGVETVKSRLRYARAKLRQQLRAWVE